MHVSYDASVEDGNSLTKQNGFDCQVDDIAGTTKTKLAVDSLDLAKCGSDSIVVRWVVYGKGSI